MEQYLNDIYRFYDDPEMSKVLIQRIDLILTFHDGFIERTPDFLESLETSYHEEFRHLYRYHAMKSKRLFNELKLAIQAKDLKLVRALLDQLDENRRDSHTIFG